MSKEVRIRREKSLGEAITECLLAVRAHWSYTHGSLHIYIYIAPPSTTVPPTTGPSCFSTLNLRLTKIPSFVCCELWSPRHLKRESDSRISSQCVERWLVWQLLNFVIWVDWVASSNQHMLLTWGWWNSAKKGRLRKDKAINCRAQTLETVVRKENYDKLRIAVIRSWYIFGLLSFIHLTCPINVFKNQMSCTVNEL